jgi:hypothetical protein
MTPSANETESEKANSPTNMANASTDPMAPIRLIISNYQPQSEFSKSAMSTLLNAMDEIYNATPVEQELNYSNLIHMLRDDFPAASFITQESISSAGPALRIIKNALILSGHPVDQSQPVIKALISVIYGTSENALNEAKELYRLRFAELTAPGFNPRGNATSSAGHQIQQVTRLPQRPSSPPRVSNRPASPVSPSFGPATSAPSDNSQFNNYYGGPASPRSPTARPGRSASRMTTRQTRTSRMHRTPRTLVHYLRLNRNPSSTTRTTYLRSIRRSTAPATSRLGTMAASNIYNCIPVTTTQLTSTTGPTPTSKTMRRRRRPVTRCNQSPQLNLLLLPRSGPLIRWLNVSAKLAPSIPAKPMSHWRTSFRSTEQSLATTSSPVHRNLLSFTISLTRRRCATTMLMSEINQLPSSRSTRVCTPNSTQLPVKTDAKINSEHFGCTPSSRPRT